MGLSNAERQQRYRDRHKKELETLRAAAKRREQAPAQRPELDGGDLYAFIARLAKEIYRRRKDNHEKNKASKWNPENTLKTEQKWLLNWIENELATILADPPPSTRLVNRGVAVNMSKDAEEQKEREWSARYVTKPRRK